MKILIQQGRVLDPATGRDEVTDVAVAAGRVVGLGKQPADFSPNRVIDARGCWVLPGLVEMLKNRAERLHQARVFPQGALTRGLKGEVLTEMGQLTSAGCVAFGQADVPLVNTQVMQRALLYASSFGYAVWLRPLDPWLGTGVAASGPLAMRMGLSGVPAVAETIALHTLFELLRAMGGSGTTPGGRVHICRLSSAAGVALLRQAKADGLNVTADVSINSLHLTDHDIGYYDSNARLNPPLRQARDRDALAAALADGTIDALVSDHTPVAADAKQLPFAEAEPGATGLELLLPLALKWGQADGGPGLMRALQAVTESPARVLGAALGTLQASCGRLAEGGAADFCVFDPAERWQVSPQALRSQGKHTPFTGLELAGRVRWTLVGGHLAHGA